MKLYELTSQYIELSEMLEQAEDISTIQNTLEAIEDAFDDKVESIVKLIRSKDAEMNAIKAEVERLSTRKSRLDREIEWLKNYIQFEMERSGRDKVKSAIFSINLANNPPKVNVIDEFEIPEKYITLKEVRTVDKRTICELLKSGESIPGVELVQERSLRIK